MVAWVGVHCISFGKWRNRGGGARDVKGQVLCRELRPSHVQAHIGIIIVSWNNWIINELLFLLFIGILKPFLDNSPDLYSTIGSKSTIVRKEKERTRSISIMSASAMVVTGNYKRASTSSQ